MKLKDRIKSYSFWTTLSAAVILFVQAFGRCFGFTISSRLVDDIIMSICGILVVLGVVIPPKEKEAGEEEKQDEENKDGE